MPSPESRLIAVCCGSVALVAGALGVSLAATPGMPDHTPSAPLFLAIDAAQTALTTCTDTASGVRVAVAVLDAAGVVHLTMSADGAASGRIEAATARARAALRGGVRSGAVATTGAVPLIVGGQLLGAVGVAGGTVAQDQRCAMAGAARIIDKLK